MSVYYVLAPELAFVKIGFAEDARKRFSKIQTDSPVRLVLAGTTQNARAGAADHPVRQAPISACQGASASHRAPAFSEAEGIEAATGNRAGERAVGSRLCRGSHFHDGSRL